MAPTRKNEEPERWRCRGISGFNSQIFCAAGAFARAASTIIARMEEKDASVKMCACGKPLHYSSPVLQAMVQDFVDRLGEDINVIAGGRCWRVPRHFIALHGIKASELSKLGFPEVPDATV